MVAPAGGSKVERALRLLEAAEVRRLQRDGLSQCVCESCGRLMFEYRPPARVLIKCRRCGAWNHLTEEATPPS